MKPFTKVSIIAAIALSLAICGRISGIDGSPRETSPTKETADRLTDPLRSEDSFVRFNTMCLSGPGSQGSSINQVNPGPAGNFLKKSRKHLEVKAIKGFSPFIKNGALFGIISNGDFRIGDPHFPSHTFRAGGFLTCLRKLRI